MRKTRGKFSLGIFVAFCTKLFISLKSVSAEVHFYSFDKLRSKLRGSFLLFKSSTLSCKLSNEGIFFNSTVRKWPWKLSVFLSSKREKRKKEKKKSEIISLILYRNWHKGQSIADIFMYKFTRKYFLLDIGSSPDASIWPRSIRDRRQSNNKARPVKKKKKGKKECADPKKFHLVGFPLAINQRLKVDYWSYF